MYHLLKTIPENGSSLIKIEISKFYGSGIVSYHNCFETSCQIYWFSNCKELNDFTDEFGFSVPTGIKELEIEIDILNHKENRILMEAWDG